ncbi:hypothetical protein X777_07246 [Ooceraea biroi]|uniref:Uncharacterized protein n=1 Tax=Ooceraea biroi TaxID=2015173 RepID=A0A026WAR1_OOCBI|nr:hypothetical protein X777_07246 [Ooceraea biroi]
MPRITIEGREFRKIQIGRCDASNATRQLWREESTVSELSSPPRPLPSPAPFAAVFSSRVERRGEKGERGAGSPQSERAERRYLKHMQRVQLRSGSHRGEARILSTGIPGPEKYTRSESARVTSPSKFTAFAHSNYQRFELNNIARLSRL